MKNEARSSQLQPLTPQKEPPSSPDQPPISQPFGSPLTPNKAPPGLESSSRIPIEAGMEAPKGNEVGEGDKMTAAELREVIYDPDPDHDHDHDPDPNGRR